MLDIILLQSTLGTAGKVISSISPVLSAIPVAGAVLSAVGGIAGGLMQQSAAKKQAEQAAKIRQDALNTKTQNLRPEFLKKKRMDEMGYINGLPGYEIAKGNIANDAANSLRAIRESSVNGASTVNAISSALASGRQAQTGIDIKNAEYKASKLNDIGNTSWAIGEKQRQLEDIRDKQRTQGLTAASAFDNAATGNKMNAANTIIGALTSTGAALGKAATNQQYMKMLSDTTAGNGTQEQSSADKPIVDNGDNMLASSEGSLVADPQAKLNDLLASDEALAGDDVSFLTGMFNQLAISGTQEDRDLAMQIRQKLQAQ